MEKELVQVYVDLGKRLKERRKELKLSQKQVAELSVPPLDRSKISDIENGKEDFTFSTLLKLCKALKIDVKDLF